MAAASAEPGSGYQLLDNLELSRFELHDARGELLSFAHYRVDGNNLVVPHVETIAEHRGNDHAARLMEAVLAELRRSQRTITPLCWFAAGHIRDRPEHHDLVVG